MVTGDQLDLIGEKMSLLRPKGMSDQDFAQKLLFQIKKDQPLNQALNGFGVSVKILLESVQSDFMKELRSV